MKIFNTLQELWSYCLFCPVCRQMDRTIDISIGPDASTEFLSYEKVNENLQLSCKLYLQDKEHNVKFDINCLNNSLQITFISEKLSGKRIIQSKKPYLYMGFNSNCAKCAGISHLESSFMELDINNKQVLRIGLEQESIYLLQPKDKYHVTFYYRKSMMYITRCVLEEDGSILDENNIFKFPIINLDLTNQEKCVNKIKTILIFS